MQTIKVKLERSSLEDKFDVISQLIDTDVLITMQSIARLEKAINDLSELKERFAIYAILAVKRYYYYNGNCSIVPRLFLKLTEIQDYLGEKIMDYDKIIED